MLSTRTLSLAVGVALLCGCAAFNPYVTPYPQLDEINGAGSDSGEHPAVQGARRLQGELARNLDQHTLVGSISGSLLIPLASLVAYKGATGAGPHNIAALSAGGFAGYGAVQYLYKRPRELIYVAGIGSIDCAIRLTQPYLWQDPLKQSRSDAHVSVQRVVSEVGLLRSEAASELNPSPAAVLRVVAGILEEEIHSLKSRLAGADSKIAHRVALSSRYEAQLSAAAYRTIGEVNQQLAYLAPDPVRLKSLLSPLAQPPPPTTPKDSSATSTLSGMGGAISELADIETDVENERLQASERTRVLSAELSSMRSQASETDPGREKLRGDRIAQKQEAADAAVREEAVLARLLSRVKRAVQVVGNAHAMVELALNSTPPDPEPPKAIDYADCGVEPPQALFTATTVLDKTTIKVAPGGSETVLASGGVGTPRVVVVLAPPADKLGSLAVASTDYAAGVSKIVITTTAAVPVGVYAVDIDGALLRVDVAKPVP